MAKNFSSRNCHLNKDLIRQRTGCIDICDKSGLARGTSAKPKDEGVPVTQGGTKKMGAALRPRKGGVQEIRQNFVGPVWSLP